MAANIEAKITEALADPDLREEERTFLDEQLRVFRAFNAQVLAQDGETEKIASVTREFSPGARKDLQRNKAYVFEDPLDTSLSRLVAANKPFGYITNRNDTNFMNTMSRPSQIAIFPEPARFYVPESNNLGLDGQKRRIREDMEEEIKGRMRIGGVDMIMGDVATHTGLVFAYFDRNRRRVRLHGVDYGYNYARTETPSVGSDVALVGNFGEFHGLSVVGWPRGRGYGIVWALRLVVPA